MIDYIRQWAHDVRMAWQHYRYIRRHLRVGGNPDEAF